jgi:putative protease
MELLSPAGNYTKASYAFNYGADAVYMGSGFSLRKGADENSSFDLRKTIELAKNTGKKVYVAANVFFHNSHVDDFKKYLEELSDIKPDAVIVSDFGMINYIAKNYPFLEIHVSTQASVTNYETARFLKDIGAKRIIPARELRIEEIKDIIDKSGIDIEVFCHGAMCMSYSGRCMLSAFMTKDDHNPAKKEKNRRLRDANLGDCAHPCRWEYKITEKMRPSLEYSVEEEDGFMKIFNSHDLCLIKHLESLRECGVKSIKIEGRMKSSYYVALTAMVYRDALDKGFRDEHYLELDKVSHRPFCEGFTFGDDSVTEPVLDESYVRKTMVLGNILEDIGDNSYRVDVLNKIEPKDELEIISPGFKKMRLKKNDFQLLDINGTPLTKAVRHTDLVLKTKVQPGKYSIIRKDI